MGWRGHEMSILRCLAYAIMKQASRPQIHSRLPEQELPNERSSCPR